VVLLSVVLLTKSELVRRLEKGQVVQKVGRVMYVKESVSKKN
jgi:hypothetical protein